MSYDLEHPDLRLVPVPEPEPKKVAEEDNVAKIGRKMLSALSQITLVSVPVQEMTREIKPEEDDGEETEEGDL